jgi:PAS domain S-box-containing protein
MYETAIKVLSIEDNPADARLIQELLAPSTNPRLEVVHAGRLADGLRELRDGKIDVILVDLNLPDSHGLATLETITGHAPAMPMIVLTGAVDESLGIAALKSGATDYLVKGQIDEKLLVRSIRHAIERKRMEETLRKSETELRRTHELLETVTAGTEVLIAAQDRDMRYIYFNKAYREEIQRLTGKDIQIGSSMPEIFAHMPEQQKNAMQNWRRALNGETESYTVEFGDPRRRRRIYSIRHSPLRDSSRKIIGAGEVAHDVTEQVRMQKALDEAVKRARDLEAVINRSPAIVLQWRPSEGWPVEYVTANIARLAYTADDLTSGRLTWSRIIHPDDLPRLEAELRRYLESGVDEFVREYRLHSKDGGIRWVEDTTRVVRGPNGEIARLESVVWDITEHKHGEEEIRRQNAIVEGIRDIFLQTIDRDTEEEIGRICLAVAEKVTESKFGFIGEVNPQTGRLNDIAISDPGWELCSMEDKSGHGKMPPTGFKLHGIYARAVLDGRGFFTNDPASHPDSIGVPSGHPPLTCFLGVPLIHGGRTIGMVALGNREGGYDPRDVAAMEALAGPIVQVLMKRRAQEALAESENRLRSLADSVPSILMRFDKNRRVLYASSKAQELSGIESSELVGKGIAHMLLPRDVMESWEKAIEAVWGTGRTTDVELDIPRGNGTRTFILRLAPELDSSGEVEHVLGVATDVTKMREAAAVLERDREELAKIVEEKSRELIASRLEVERAKRLSDIGTLAATVAHELRNPLGAMNLAVFNLKRKCEDPDLLRHFNTIEKKIGESGEIIDNLLFYSRLRPPTYQSVRLGDLIDDALGSLRAPADDKAVKIRRETKRAADLTIEADPLQIKELLVNLISNAYDAVGETGGVIEVGARREDGDHVKIYVKDNGRGIDAENLDRIWEPFFSTKSKGTGLGLSVCRQIAILHNGSIEIQSATGQGTLATLSLPVRRRSAAT